MQQRIKTAKPIHKLQAFTIQYDYQPNRVRLHLLFLISSILMRSQRFKLWNDETHPLNLNYLVYDACAPCGDNLIGLFAEALKDHQDIYDFVPDFELPSGYMGGLWNYFDDYELRNNALSHSCYVGLIEDLDWLRTKISTWDFEFSIVPKNAWLMLDIPQPSDIADWNLEEIEFYAKAVIFGLPEETADAEGKNYNRELSQDIKDCLETQAAFIRQLPPDLVITFDEPSQKLLTVFSREMVELQRKFPKHPAFCAWLAAHTERVARFAALIFLADCELADLTAFCVDEKSVTKAFKLGYWLIEQTKPFYGVKRVPKL